MPGRLVESSLQVELGLCFIIDSASSRLQILLAVSYWYLVLTGQNGSVFARSPAISAYHCQRGDNAVCSYHSPRGRQLLLVHLFRFMAGRVGVLCWLSPAIAWVRHYTPGPHKGSFTAFLSSQCVYDWSSGGISCSSSSSISGGH